MHEGTETALVRKGIVCGVTGCCVWNEKAERRLRRQPPLANVTPEGIIELLQAYVIDGGEIGQIRETREEFTWCEYYYKAIVPVDGLTHGLFVEMILTDDDADVPTVEIVNCHPQMD